MSALRPVCLAFAFVLGLAAAALAATSAFPAPIVVVYPLTLSGGVTGTAGSDAATLLATRIGDPGTVIVRPYTPGTTRALFLDAALKAGADYYVTGYLQPLGSDISMVAQVVSTHSGSVVFSTTAEVRTYADIAAQAEPLRVAILRHAGRGLAALDAPPPAPSPSAAPTKGAQGVNLTRALRRRGRATPAPTSTPTSDAGLVPTSELNGTPAPIGTRPGTAVPAAVAAEPAMVIVLEVAGSESADARTYAETALVNALRAKGIRAAELNVNASDGRKNAPSLCRANPGTNRFLAPTLLLSKGEGGGPSAQLSVDAIDCMGAALGTHLGLASGTARGGAHSAIDAAVAKLVPMVAAT